MSSVFDIRVIFLMIFHHLWRFVSLYCRLRMNACIISLLYCAVVQPVLMLHSALWLLDNAVIAESAEFQMAKSKNNHKSEHLQHIVKQQRARLEQTSIELNGTEKEVSLALVSKCES